MTEIPGNRFTKIYLILWGLCVFAALAVLILYKSGYRLTGHFQPVKVGAIELSSNEQNFQIFLNNRDQKISENSGYYVISDVTPGLHSVAVSKESFWPWAKTVSVSENNVRKLYAFMFPISGIAVNPLMQGKPEYAAAAKAVRESVLPEPKPGSSPFLPDASLKQWLDSNAPSRQLSFDKTTALYVQDNTIYVAWISDSEPPPHYFCEDNPCKLVMPVIVLNDSVKNTAFYKDRNDVILFSAGSTIYAIEVDREGTQNFQPLYKGKDPYFYETDKSILYIKDGNALLKAGL